MTSARSRKVARARVPRTRAGRFDGPLEREARAVLLDAARGMAKLGPRIAAQVAAAADAMIGSLESGGTVFFCGNGGSAADAQHFACELAGRYMIDRPSLAAISLTTNTSSLTAIGNDYSFDEVFARQLESLGTPGDVLVAITTSGSSRNVLRAVRSARRLGMTVIGMTGLKGQGPEFAATCDYAMVTPNTVTPRIQEGHLAMGHAFCQLVERALFGHGRESATAGSGAASKKSRGGRSASSPRAARKTARRAPSRRKSSPAR